MTESQNQPNNSLTGFQLIKILFESKIKCEIYFSRKKQLPKMEEFVTDQATGLIVSNLTLLDHLTSVAV